MEITGRVALLGTIHYSRTLGTSRSFSSFASDTLFEMLISIPGRVLIEFLMFFGEILKGILKEPIMVEEHFRVPAGRNVFFSSSGNQVTFFATLTVLLVCVKISRTTKRRISIRVPFKHVEPKNLFENSTISINRCLLKAGFLKEPPLLQDPGCLFHFP